LLLRRDTGGVADEEAGLSKRAILTGLLLSTRWGSPVLPAAE
jgi:hypothetical protein